MEAIIILNFTPKEMSLLNDEKSHEQECIDRYTKFAVQANAQELKDLFNNLAQKEQQHFNTLNQMINGTLPSMSSGGNSNPPPAPKAVTQSTEDKNADKFLCQDSLSAEKYVSATYDTSIFEFKDGQVRDALNHIQKEEQGHGYSIWQYMNANGMYN